MNKTAYELLRENDSTNWEELDAQLKGLKLSKFMRSTRLSYAFFALNAFMDAYFIDTNENVNRVNDKARYTLVNALTSRFQDLIKHWHAETGIAEEELKEHLYDENSEIGKKMRDSVKVGKKVQGIRFVGVNGKEIRSVSELPAQRHYLDERDQIRVIPNEERFPTGVSHDTEDVEGEIATYKTGKGAQRAKQVAATGKTPTVALRRAEEKPEEDYDVDKEGGDENHVDSVRKIAANLAGRYEKHLRDNGEVVTSRKDIVGGTVVYLRKLVAKRVAEIVFKPMLKAFSAEHNRNEQGAVDRTVESLRGQLAGSFEHQFQINIDEGPKATLINAILDQAKDIIDRRFIQPTVGVYEKDKMGCHGKDFSPEDIEAINYHVVSTKVERHLEMAKEELENQILKELTKDSINRYIGKSWTSTKVKSMDDEINIGGKQMSLHDYEKSKSAVANRPEKPKSRFGKQISARQAELGRKLRGGSAVDEEDDDVKGESFLDYMKRCK